MWFFKKKNKETGEPVHPSVADFGFLGCDMHSHLVPGIDDGAATPEDSLALIRDLQALGYRKLITTPHTHVEFYNNRIDDVRERFAALKQLVADNGIDIELGIGSEYFLDEFFEREVLPHGLLTFGDNQVLVEVSMAGWPRQFHDHLFAVQSRNYKPILAHPERYQYETNPSVFHKLKEKGVSMQLNLLSVLGYYGRGVKELADRYLQEGLYDYCGTDLHHPRHLAALQRLFSAHPGTAGRLAAYGFKNEELLV